MIITAMATAGVIETLQSGGAHPSHSTFFGIMMLTHIRFFPYCLPLLSPSIVSSRESDRGSRVSLVGLGANVLLTERLRRCGMVCELGGVARGCWLFIKW